MITPTGLYTLTFYDVVRFVRTTFFDRLTENKYELYDDCRRTECIFVKPLFFGISAGGRKGKTTWTILSLWGGHEYLDRL